MGNPCPGGILQNHHCMMNVYRHIKTGVEITTVCTLGGTAWVKVEPEKANPEPAAPAAKKTATRRKAK